jgi:hypothetical protein
MTAMVQSIIEHVKDIVAKRSEDLQGSAKLLQAELYLEWLREYTFVITAVQVCTLLYARRVLTRIYTRRTFSAPKHQSRRARHYFPFSSI